MHVAYIISQYPAVSHTFVQREVLALRKRGWSITSISIRPPAICELLTSTDRDEAQQTHVILPPSPLALFAAFIAPLFKNPIRFTRALNTAWQLRHPGLRGILWSLFYFAEALLVHRLCRRLCISHLHAHFANVASDVAMIASVLNCGTFSFTMHGPTEFFDIRQHRLAEKTAAATAVICISDFARSQLMALVPFTHWNKLEVVHCGVDPQQFQTPRPQEIATPRNKRAMRLLCVARLVPVKGHAILLQALAGLLARGFPIHLTLIGDGPSRCELEALINLLGIAPSIHFAGNVGQDQIAAHFAAASLFVLPSFAEGVPVVLMEAMAARCPVIATRIAGIAELIDDGRSGILVPPGRADLLAQAIERMLLDPVAMRHFAENGHEKVHRDFNLHKVAHQLSDVFQKHLPSARSFASPAASARQTEAPAVLLAPAAATPGGAA